MSTSRDKSIETPFKVGSKERLPDAGTGVRGQKSILPFQHMNLPYPLFMLEGISYAMEKDDRVYRRTGEQ